VTVPPAFASFLIAMIPHCCLRPIKILSRKLSKI